ARDRRTKERLGREALVRQLLDWVNGLKRQPPADYDQFNLLKYTHDALYRSSAQQFDLLKHTRDALHPMLWTLPKHATAIKIPTIYTIDDKGRLGVGQSFLAAKLGGIDVHRIKRCPVDGNLYFARPSHKQGCSARCCDVIRVRKVRQSPANKNHYGGK